MADSGRLVPMAVTPAATDTTPSGCEPVKNGVVEVPLTAPVFAWSWAVRIGYLADADASATVSLGRGRQDVSLAKGLGEVYVQLEGGGETLRITGLPPSVNFCVGDVQVGAPAPKG
jgi:hypothetical protein